MKGSLTEDPEFERAHQEKDVLKLRKLLKNINLKYKRREESINTLWQVDNDFIIRQQHTIDLTANFERLKATKKVVEELNRSSNGYAAEEIFCKEENISASGLGVA